ncbi:murein biosynthesis integral membrane protein MurJ [Patescibacteria group bacterium]|nr:murein biosynthesis integral membrane protein MurJ [Patescibacteria group bacterium]
MIHKLITRRSSIFEATLVLAAASLISRVFGLVRDRTLFSHFGAGDVLDAYFAAFKIPDFIFNLLILGALSSAFIPIFTEYLKKEGKEEAWSVVNSLVNFGVVLLTGILLLLAIFAPYLTKIIAPGFVGDKHEMVTNLMRVMLLSPFFFGLSNLAGGILNSFKNFLVYAIAPILYNIGIILGVIYLVPRFGYMGLAYGVVLGAFLHMIIQLPGVFALGYRYRMRFNFRHPALRRIATLMIPRTMGIAAQQVSVLVNTVIASTLAVGSVSVLNGADNLQSLPISIFGISFAVAVFPTLAEKYTLQKVGEFKDDFTKTLRQILYLILPMMLLYWLLRAQIVRLAFGAGQFSWEDTRFMVSTLAFFTFGMAAQALIPLLARSFYALQDTKTPFWTSVLTLVVNVAAALLLIPYLKVVGLALAVSLAATINALILFILLRRRLGGLGLRPLWVMAGKILIGIGAMGAMGYGALQIMSLVVNTHTFWGLFLQAGVAATIAGLTYLAVTKKLGLPEVKMIIKPSGLLGDS